MLVIEQKVIKSSLIVTNEMALTYDICLMAPIPPRWQGDLADTEQADLSTAFSVRQCLALPGAGCD